MTDDELKQLVASLTIAQQQQGNDKRLKEPGRFKPLFPEHQGQKFHGIAAEPLKQHILNGGFYAASIQDDIFRLVPPTVFYATAL
ncbi:MAG: hypothetical protein WAW36_14350 [Methylovulum miyakonense]|uniref:hypothetical protein n=1 Tax=Methylovulum miyakonense TaxID=645578 RepID=UPI003BB6D8E7